MMQSTKMGFGLGEYKFGNEVISAKDIAVKSSQIKYKSMLDEAMSNISPSNIKELSKPNIPIPESEINWDDFMLGDQEVEPLDFDSDSNEIDFNKPYKMSIIK